MPEPQYTPYTPVASLPRDAQGNLYVNPWHIGDNLTYVQGMLERLSRSLAASGGVLLPGAVSLAGNTLTVTGPFLGISGDGKLPLLIDPDGAGATLNLNAGSPPAGKHTVCLRPLPRTTAAHTFLSPGTGESLTDTLTLTAGDLVLLVGTASAYPTLPGDAVPVANVTLTGAVWTLDAVLTAPPLFQSRLGEPVSPNPAATGTVNLALGVSRFYALTLTGNTVLTLSGPPPQGGDFRLLVKQDATGGRTLTFPASVKWPGGTVPTLGGAANAVSLLQFVTADGGATWLGALLGANFA